jgi:Fe-S-cluster containining protein
MKLSSQQQEEFRLAVKSAMEKAEVARAIGNVYTAVSDAIELRKPLCITSGRCCRFDDFGHRLFVTTMEMAAFMQHNPSPVPQMNGGCPYQQEKLCSVHAIRPFGCRIFFCDETSTEWQQEQYERFHAELKRLHERLAVPYFYVEWREALNALRSPLPPGEGQGEGALKIESRSISNTPSPQPSPEGRGRKIHHG